MKNTRQSQPGQAVEYVVPCPRGQQDCRSYYFSAILKEVDQIVQKTLKQMSERKGEIWKPPSRIIGVFSTAGRCGKTAFAMALALKLGSKRSVLRIS